MKYRAQLRSTARERLQDTACGRFQAGSGRLALRIRNNGAASIRESRRKRFTPHAVPLFPVASNAWLDGRNPGNWSSEPDRPLRDPARRGWVLSFRPCTPRMAGTVIGSHTHFCDSRTFVREHGPWKEEQFHPPLRLARRQGQSAALDAARCTVSGQFFLRRLRRRWEMVAPGGCASGCSEGVLMDLR